MSSYTSTTYWKKFFLHYTAFIPLQISWLCLHGSISLFFSIDLSILLPMPMSWLLQFYSKSEIRAVSIIWLFCNLWGLFWSLPLHVNFWISLLKSTEPPDGILTGVVLLTILSSYPWTWKTLQLVLGFHSSPL